MADLAVVNPITCDPVLVIEQYTGPAAEAINAGQLVRMDVDGTVILAFDHAQTPEVAQGIAIKTVLAGETVTFVRKGWVNCGDVFAGMDIGADVFMSDTPGLMADATAQGGGVIGTVVPAWGRADRFNRILRVDL